MSDTIAAIATAPGPSAIGVVRLSGPDTCTVLDRVFRPKNGRPMSRQEPRRLVLGDVLDRDGQVIDSALAVLFPGPGSYTGQDCGELQCHGSPVVLDAALAAMLAAGARQAKGGEFTRRAFLNGRMDLLQAEAVADLIDAETAQAAHNAVGQLEGVLSRTVAEIYDGLMAIVSRFYAVVDYPDEDIGDLQREDMLDTLRRAENRLEELLATFSRGKLLKLGVPTVILGRPNVGKSSLLNALLGYDRAIVTDVAGTTRDTVEEKVRVGHVLLRLCDTAGIHQTEDAVEKIGVERARAAARQASLALLVLDGSTPLTDADREAMDLARQAPNLLVAVNKSDLPRAVDIGRLADEFDNVVSLSARSGEGVSVLCDGAAGYLLGEALQSDYFGPGVLTVLVFALCRQWHIGRLPELAAMLVINGWLLPSANMTLWGVTLPVELLATAALLPIWLYRGRQGPHGPWLRWVWYGFYPAHLLVLWLIDTKTC